MRVYFRGLSCFLKRLGRQGSHKTGVREKAQGVISHEEEENDTKTYLAHQKSLAGKAKQTWVLSRGFINRRSIRSLEKEGFWVGAICAK